MKVAWCPQHRGVMRISFFNPPTKHFDSPCPRCGNELIQQERGKYEKEVIVEEDHTGEVLYEGSWVFPDEVPTKAPSRQLCNCCEFFYQPDSNYFCSWCEDCPTEYCDIPRRIITSREKEKGV